MEIPRIDCVLIVALVCASALAAADNNPPVAFPISASVYVNSSINLQLLADDGDAGVDQPLQFIITNPANGTISNFSSSTGSLTYTPAAGFTGRDSFFYFVRETATGLTSQSISASINVLRGITTSTASPQAGETIMFFPAQIDSGVIRSIFWNFGDGTTANIPTVQHAYAEPGNYLVELTISDGTNSFYFSMYIVVTLERLTIGYLKINLDFANPHSDALELKGKLPGVSESANVVIDVGGIRHSFVMDAARNSVIESARLKFSDNPGHPNEFIALFNNGDFLPLLTDDGFSPGFAEKSLRLLPINISVDDIAYFKLQQVSYTSVPRAPNGGAQPARAVAISGNAGEPGVSFIVTIREDFRRPARNKFTLKAALPIEANTAATPVWIDIGGFRFGDGGQNVPINISSDKKRAYLTMTLTGDTAPKASDFGWTNRNELSLLNTKAQVNGRVYYQAVRGRYLYNSDSKTGTFTGK